MAGKVRSKLLAAKTKQMLERLIIIHGMSKSVTPENKELFIQQTRDLDHAKAQYEEAIGELEEVRAELDENYEPSYAAVNEYLKMVDEVKVVLNRVSPPPPPSHNPRVSLNTSSGPVAAPRVKLEAVRLLDFDGSPEAWAPFYEQFSELIDRNEEYSDLQKVSYLVGHLTGSARSIVAGIAPTEANYPILFQTLKDRFEDKRALGHYYLDKIMNAKPLSQESEKGLNSFLDEFVGGVAALKKLGITELFDFFLVHLATKKLDADTMRQFDMAFRDDAIPKYDDLVKFVRAQAKILARNTKKPNPPNKPGSSKPSQAFVTQQVPNGSVGEGSGSTSTCPCCKAAVSHPLEKCPAFLKMEPKSRFHFIQSSKRCYRCLAKHFSKSCRSSVTCPQCQRTHNELLHFGNGPPAPAQTQSAPAQGTPSSTPSLTAATSSISPCLSTVLLATAQVVAFDKFGKPVTLRALLDNGSQSHFLRKESCEALGLTPATQHSVIRCLGQNSAPIEGQVSLSFRSRLRPDVKFSIDALVMEELTDSLPAVPVNLAELSHLLDLPLADQTFNIPGPIDLLIGAQLWPIICGTNRVVGPPNTPFGLESSLGWLVMGSAPVSSCLVSSSCFAATLELEDPVDKLLEKFWLLEEIPSTPVPSPEDDECERIFLENVERNEKGRFTVALPFKLSPDLLGDSFRMAAQRFLVQERRFVKNPVLQKQYSEVIRSYLEEGYMSLMPSAEVNSGESAYYIPHHGVLKPESSSTPLRVVLNASAESTSGLSLNDVLHVGPKLQNNLVGVLLNFRLFQYTLSADVRQMYLRILVRPQDRRFQRIVWRFSPQEELCVYQMNTVVFGLGASPYLALRVVRHLISLEGHKFPLAASSAARDMYVDDYLTSVPSVSEACSLQREMDSLFASGSFTLAKWASNSSEILAAVPDELKSSEYLKFDSEPQLKVLGLEWNPTTDVFAVKVNLPSEKCTKRSMSSAIARIFDPLGFLAPVTILAKGFVKTLWTLHLDWDQTPPESLIQQWDKFVEELPLLRGWSIPRHLFVTPESTSYLVGYADASQTAYGAVLYVVTAQSAGGAQVNLLLAKSKVAPVKTTSIPRLELCAAVMLSSLLRFALENYVGRYKFERVFAFTDSTVTLQWLSSSSSRWKVFVANRVSKIQQNSDTGWWYHIKGDTNPADCLSRGLSAKALLEHEIWFKGPSWLAGDPSGWPVTRVQDLGAPLRPSEERIVSLAATTPAPWILLPLLNRLSSYRKLIRATAHILRALRLTRFRSGPLQVAEVEDAEHRWLVQVQRQYFPEIFEYLECASNKARKRLKRNPLIGRLDLFVENGLIRVGGRLNFSRIPYDQRHPVLLPKSGKFVELLVDQIHMDNLHTGPHVMLSLINLRFWILSARNIVRQRVHKCNLCFRAKPRPLNPKMAPLPAVRFQQCKAFLHCGVDYAGPFSISMVRKRGGSAMKAYVCMFICLSTKAVHFELASSLSTECFLAAFRRFLARRGPCQVICSDQGTNFIGAKNKLSEMHMLTASGRYNADIGDELAWKGIEWRLNPPSAPHFGGIWERNIQSFKSLLYKIINDKLLTYEEFNTVITQIEAVMNSRPLSVLSSDPNGPSALTPAHFLALGPTLDRLPNEDLSSVPPNRLDHYQRVTQIVQSFWKRWQQEYLHTLQGREKWTEDAPPLSKGTVVVILQENTPPLRWPLAVVEEVCLNPDGVTRVAKLRTSRGELTRPIVKLCPLPTQ